MLTLLHTFTNLEIIWTRLQVETDMWPDNIISLEVINTFETR